MSFVTRQAAHCDQCSHEWLVVGASTPTHCAKCKSRRWNGGAVAQPDTALVIAEACRMRLDGGVAQHGNASGLPEVSGSSPDTPTTISANSSKAEQLTHNGQDVGSTPASRTKPDMQALRDICAGKIEQASPPDHPVEIAICGKTWWEEGEQYECLMDKGHREALAGKHGLRGMVRRLED